MKVVSNRIVEVQEGVDELQIKPITLSVSVIKLSEETAQVVVIDPRIQTFSNFICVMNLAEKTSASVLVDEQSEESKTQ